MAPEQLQGERAFDRSDLWAIAVIAVIAADLASQQHPSGAASGIRRRTGTPDCRRASPSQVVALLLRAWLRSAGAYPGYRRPTAEDARQQLESLWP